MKRLSQINLNTPHYFDGFFNEKEIDSQNLLRQETYLRLIEPFKPRSVIELGCGISYFPALAAEKYESAWGLDFAAKTIERLRREIPEVNYVEGDATDTPFRDGFFNAVVAGEIIEHLEEPEELIREMGRICAFNGVILVSTPHLEFDDPEHLWEFEEDDLIEMLSMWGKPQTMTINSDRFKGRSYIFAWVQKTK